MRPMAGCDDIEITHVLTGVHVATCTSAHVAATLVATLLVAELDGKIEWREKKDIKRAQDRGFNALNL